MSELAILVVSCDRYADLWDPFFQIFRKRWPDCPYPVFLGSNHKKYPNQGVNPVPVGEDRGWGRNLRLMLDNMGVRRVILFLEDFLLLTPVNTQRVQELAQLVEEQGVGCLRLYPHPPPTRRIRGIPGLGEIRPGDDWRVSTQTAIWDTELLYSLSWPEFSAWDFESIGSLVSDRMTGRFWGVYEPAIDYQHAVWRGKWMQSGLAICREAGVSVDPAARGIMSETEFGQMPGQDKWRPRSVVKSLLPDFMYRMLLRRVRLRRGPGRIEDYKQQTKDRNVDSAGG
ncbi:MAG: hypothetical protein HY914_00575 [Desulfomonile tiedjei]|nr:hypothetical protein [Desulfomonile tiedjei]